MKSYQVFGTVVGTKYLGTFKANSPEEAVDMALEEASVELCHQCEGECEDAQIEEAYADEC